MEKSKKDTITTLAVLLVIVVIVTGSLIVNKKKSSSVQQSAPTVDTSQQGANTTEQTPSTETATAPSTAATTSGYKDGSYKVTADYSTPEDQESITISVSIKDGVITDTSANASTRSRESKQYATAFVEGYKDVVIGKSIANLRLSRVSGASLTSQGFNSAIAKIREQAQI